MQNPHSDPRFAYNTESILCQNPINETYEYNMIPHLNRNVWSSKPPQVNSPSNCPFKTANKRNTWIRTEQSVSSPSHNRSGAWSFVGIDKSNATGQKSRGIYARYQHGNDVILPSTFPPTMTNEFWKCRQNHRLRREKPSPSSRIL